MKGKTFLILPMIAIGIIIYIVMINIPASTPQITYEINTLSELCDNVSTIYGGRDLEFFQSKVRESSGNMGTLQSLQNEYVDNIMWNNKINPSLYDPVRQHALGYKYLECE